MAIDTRDHPSHQPGQPVPRSYFVPSNLPSRPTGDEIAALEKYFGSTTSSQSRPISTARPHDHLQPKQSDPEGFGEVDRGQGQGRPQSHPQAQAPQHPNVLGFNWGAQGQGPFGVPPVFPSHIQPLQGDPRHPDHVPQTELPFWQQPQPHPHAQPQSQARQGFENGFEKHHLQPFRQPEPYGEDESSPEREAQREQGGQGLLHPDSAKRPGFFHNLLHHHPSAGHPAAHPGPAQTQTHGPFAPNGQNQLENLSPDPHPHPHPGQPPYSPDSRSPYGDDQSLAPSQSLSQLAVRRARRSKEKVERRSSTGGLGRSRSKTGQGAGEKKARRLTGYYDQAPKQDQYNSDDKSQKEGNMNIDDWARSQTGQTHSHRPAESEVGYSPHRRRTGGTNVDLGSDDEQSVRRSEIDPYYAGQPRSQAPGQGEADRATIRSRAGTGWSQVYPESQLPGRGPRQRSQFAAESAFGGGTIGGNGGNGGGTIGGGASRGGWRSPDISEGVQDSEVASMMDRMTIGARSGMTGQTGMTGMGGLPYRNMERMREALDDERREQRRLEASRARDSEGRDHSLHRSKSQLKSLQNTVRDLQARIIAEQITRSETEREATARAEEVRTYRDELAGAVRALRRAKEESRKLDDERKKGLRLFEETRERLVKLREAYKVQEAREAGRDEGRLEAFQEIERWMVNPPIPVEPLGHLPSGVLHQNDRPQPNSQEQQGQQQQQRQPQQGQGRSPQQRGPGPQSDRPPYQSFGDSADRLNQQAQRVASQAQIRARPSPGPQPDSGRDSSPREPRMMPPHSMAGANAASSYLDRAEHDPRMQNMLHGAPQRTFTMPSQAPTQHTRSRAPDTLGPPDSASMMDKPLPSPHGRSTQQNHQQAPSRAGHSRQGSQIPRDILSPPRQDYNAPFERSLSQADRYPPFPTHRTESVLDHIDHAVPLWPMQDPRGAQSVDPRGMPLPESRGTSDYQQSHVHAPSRGQGAPSNATHRTNKTARSRLAAGLRGDDDPLSMIEETDEQQMERHSPNPHRVPLPPSTAGGTHYRPARSMQSFMSSKFKPKQPVMPNPLGMAATTTTSDNNLRGMYDADRAARHTATLPDPTYVSRPEDSHPMSLSPEQHQEPVQQQYREPSGGGSRGGMPGVSRAPTIHVMPPSRGSPRREDPPSAFDNGISPFVHPADIPLPETRPGTMYGTEINHPQGHHLQNRHSINAIDFAQRHPLPESRPTTIMERQSNGTHRQSLAATVEDAADIDVPMVRRGPPGPSILKRDPALLPLPHSKAPTRRKTSSKLEQPVN